MQKLMYVECPLHSVITNHFRARLLSSFPINPRLTRQAASKKMVQCAIGSSSSAPSAPSVFTFFADINYSISRSPTLHLTLVMHRMDNMVVVTGGRTTCFQEKVT